MGVSPVAHNTRSDGEDSVMIDDSEGDAADNDNNGAEDSDSKMVALEDD